MAKLHRDLLGAAKRSAAKRKNAARAGLALEHPDAQRHQGRGVTPSCAVVPIPWPR